MTDDRGVDTTDTDTDEGRAVATPSSGTAVDAEPDGVDGGRTTWRTTTATTETTAARGA